MSIPFDFAYHVTDIVHNEERRYNKLIATVADDLYHDGAMVGLKVVWFGTTLYNQRLPDMSTYPRKGKTGQFYKRVLVSMRNFDSFKVWKCEVGVPNQIRLMLTNNCLHDILLSRTEGFELINITQPNNFLWQKEDGKWFTNDHSHCQWVSFAVIGDFYFHSMKSCFQIHTIDGLSWDRVKRLEIGGGTPLLTDDSKLKICIEFWEQRLMEYEREDPYEVLFNTLTIKSEELLSDVHSLMKENGMDADPKKAIDIIRPFISAMEKYILACNNSGTGRKATIDADEGSYNSMANEFRMKRTAKYYNPPGRPGPTSAQKETNFYLKNQCPPLKKSFKSIKVTALSPPPAVGESGVVNVRKTPSLVSDTHGDVNFLDGSGPLDQLTKAIGIMTINSSK